MFTDFIYILQNTTIFIEMQNKYVIEEIFTIGKKGPKQVETD